MDRDGKVLGYVEDLQCGSADSRFLGELEREASDHALVAKDADDNVVARLFLDSCRLVDPGGSTMSEVKSDGRVLGARSQQLAEIRPFSYQIQAQVALYLLFVDPGVLEEWR